MQGQESGMGEVRCQWCAEENGGYEYGGGGEDREGEGECEALEGELLVCELLVSREVGDVRRQYQSQDRSTHSPPPFWPVSPAVQPWPWASSSSSLWLCLRVRVAGRWRSMRTG